MVAAWPEPVERVSSFLRESAAEARIQELPDGAPTAAEAAEAVGCGLERIVKSLVLVCADRTIVALVPGDRRGDMHKIAHAVGASKARVATAAEVEDATGFAPGAVAPFPLPRVAAVLIEHAILQHSFVWAGAGSPSHLLGMAPLELARVARARPVDVVADQPYDSSRPKES